MLEALSILPGWRCRLDAFKTEQYFGADLQTVMYRAQLKVAVRELIQCKNQTIKTRTFTVYYLFFNEFSSLGSEQKSLFLSS